ncbi:MAG: glycosyltransferase [Candidatus Nanohaloarchaea archaeon]
MRISVVIPAKNEADYIEGLFQSIEMQKFDDYEIILADGGSDDGTTDIAAEYGAKILSEDDDGPGEARNSGAEMAEGDILLFLDSDVELEHEDVFSDVDDAMREDGVIAGSSTWKTFDANLRGHLLLGSGSRLMKMVHVLGMSVAVGNFLFVDREIFEEVGGFDEELPYHEDHDLMERIEPKGKVVMLDREFRVSGRRISNRGFFGTLMDYLPPSIEYWLGREDQMKERYEFTSGSS